MNILVAIVLFGLLFWKLKNNYIGRTTLDYDFKLKAIQFKLDMLVVTNEVKVENAKYRTLNNYICCIDNKLDCLNLVVLFVYFLRDKKNKSKLAPNPKARPLSISKKDQRINTELSKIEKEFNETLFAYIVKKNVSLKVVAIANNLGVKPIKRLTNRLSVNLKDYLQYYVEKSLYKQTALSSFGI